ncbi:MULTISPECIES: bifunctional DedA family/phosphatase PAP2 family protein [unclassified Mesorhizobium]|uniref:bifunctional DedA family/phosphatase PAP2 family protein n=1 Tax=unclassified Mesorhizobium TaxID=325217 RepID=UPI0011276367|nr:MULTISPECIES: bifunctional DedA family/phosphatase PAP2 family protein [unclassified Mesorhizobium]TPK90107.1 phosphatase PAP2 family protein [Mesorhizobium sp. B2-4-16]TPL58038.1 phosphatase PAP2 family protein [Mesorhizobium sp. B2-4-3]
MLASFFTAVTALIAAHPHLAYAIVLLLALSESIPVIGVFIPGTAAILAISALVPSGVVKLWPLLGAAAAGAIVGDGLSFWVGHRYHREILERWPLNRHAELVVRSEAFFARHGDKSVFIARFTPGVRAFIPLIAGMLQMPVGRFYAANILSALVWAPSHILPAVFVGAAFGIFGAAAKPLAILVVLIAIVIWAMIHLVRFALRRGPLLLSKISGWLQTRAAASQSRWGRFVVDLLDPARPDVRGLALLALLVIGSAWLFLGVLEDVVAGDPLVRVDTAIYQALQELRTAPGDAVMLVFTELGDTVVVIAVTAAVLLWLLWKRAWRTAAYWLVAIGGASALNTIIKVTLHRARPTELFYTGWSAFSFPSGHSTVNSVLYGFLAFLVARQLRPAWRLPVAFSAASFVLLIALSRLYLGAHWLSDVVGGLAFGTAWLTAVSFFYLRKQSEPARVSALIMVGCSAFALAGGLNVYRHHTLDLERYTVKSAMPTMATDIWWNTGWQQLPAQRIDLLGEIEEPLTIQWAGSLSSLQETLLSKGWRVPTPWTALNSLAWLTGNAAPATLPVVPRLDSGRLPSLTLVLSSDTASKGSRLVLRLWPVDLELTDGTSSPVWCGSIVEEQITRPLSLFTLAWTQPDVNTPRDLMAGQLQSGRLVARANAAVMSWDGRVLLARETSQ